MEDGGLVLMRPKCEVFFVLNMANYPGHTILITTHGSGSIMLQEPVSFCRDRDAGDFYIQRSAGRKGQTESQKYKAMVYIKTNGISWFSCIKIDKHLFI